jgi:Tfp pilus assembly protein FimT
VIELAVVICIIAVVSAIAMPTATTLLDHIHVRAAVTEVESLFNSARHIAIARGTQATVEIDTATRAVSVIVAGEVVRTSAVGSSHRVHLASNRASMTYSPTGVGYGAANLSIVVQKGSATDTVVVSRLGRVRH